MVFTAVIRFYAAHHPLTTLIAVKPARTMRDYDTDDDADDDDADDGADDDDDDDDEDDLDLGR